MTLRRTSSPTLLFIFLATFAARYSECAAVDIGDACCAEELGILECTQRPDVVSAPDGRRVVDGAHQVARCESTSDGNRWQVYDVCLNGRQCLVENDGSDYQCEFP